MRLREGKCLAQSAELGNSGVGTLTRSEAAYTTAMRRPCGVRTQTRQGPLQDAHCMGPHPQPYTTQTPGALCLALGAKAPQAPRTPTSLGNPMEAAGWEGPGVPSQRDWECRARESHSCPRGGLGGSPELGLSTQTLSQAAPGVKSQLCHSAW